MDYHNLNHVGIFDDIELFHPENDLLTISEIRIVVLNTFTG